MVILQHLENNDQYPIEYKIQVMINPPLHLFTTTQQDTFDTKYVNSKLILFNNLLLLTKMLKSLIPFKPVNQLSSINKLVIDILLYRFKKTRGKLGSLVYSFPFLVKMFFYIKS